MAKTYTKLDQYDVRLEYGDFGLSWIEIDDLSAGDIVNLGTEFNVHNNLLYYDSHKIKMLSFETFPSRTFVGMQSMLLNVEEL